MLFTLMSRLQNRYTHFFGKNSSKQKINQAKGVRPKLLNLPDLTRLLLAGAEIVIVT